MESSIMLEDSQTLITREQLHKLLVSIKHNHKHKISQNTKQNNSTYKIQLPQLNCKRYKTLEQKRLHSNQSIQIDQPIIKPLELKFNRSLSSVQKAQVPKQHKFCKMIELPVKRIINSHKKTTNKMWIRQINHISAIQNSIQYDKFKVDSKGKKIQCLDLLKARKGKLLDIILNKRSTKSMHNALQPIIFETKKNIN